MTTDRLTPAQNPRTMRSTLIAVALAFLSGLALMGWLFTHWAPAQMLLPVPKPEASALPVASGSGPVASGAGESGGVPPAALASSAPVAAPVVDDSRVAALESRLAEIDRHAAIAAAHAARAEGLLLATAARRAVDRGVALGYIEGELTAHFGASQPRAVANVIAASHAPITLDGLRAGLDGVMSESAPNASKADWWGRLRANFGGLITVRKVGEATVPAPDERLSRARLALGTGAVENALADVARLPGGSTTNTWMTNARRYIEAHSALDVLEAAALMKPGAGL